MRPDIVEGYRFNEIAELSSEARIASRAIGLLARSPQEFRKYSIVIVEAAQGAEYIELGYGTTPAEALEAARDSPDRAPQDIRDEVTRVLSAGTTRTRPR